MASRPVFLPGNDAGPLVDELLVEFRWHPGMAKSQKQASIRELHDSARAQLSLGKILEISSKSEERLGVNLSAFNLRYPMENGTAAPVEVVFQGSKVFENGGPYTDLYEVKSITAKKDKRILSSGELVGFQLEGIDWRLSPRRAFYDWVYLSALFENRELADQLVTFDAFTDIEFNPKKSINCQAHSAALYKKLVEVGELENAMASQDSFLAATGTATGPVQYQETFI